MPIETGIDDYLNSLRSVDRDSLGIMINSVRVAYGDRGIKSVLVGFNHNLHDDYKELNVLLGPCGDNDENVRMFHENMSNENMRILNTYLRQNFRIRVRNYNGLWVLNRLDHEEIGKLPRVAHLPKIEMNESFPISLFLEMDGINPDRMDELRIADYMNDYAVLQNGYEWGD